MSIINGGDCSSRISTPSTNTLASNLLSRKRKRDDAPIKTQTRPKPTPTAVNPSLQKSASESAILSSSLLRQSAPKPSASAPADIVIQSADDDKTQSFRILTTLPRANLPLACIDNSKTPNRLFTAHLPQLQDVSHQDCVLIARRNDPPSGPLCAVERVGDLGQTRYSLCHLAAWVEPHHIHEFTSLRPQAAQRYSTVEGEDASSAAWWHCLAVEPPSSSVLGSRKAPRLSFCRLNTQPSNPQPGPDLAPPPVEDNILGEDVHSSAEDVFARFISQYLDTLYLSKTPLSFFTKGPLSKARVAFTGGQIHDAALPELVKFLRVMIHSSSTADKKYRDKLPELLKDLPAQAPGRDGSPGARKKRRKKKLKPDKSGLLPDESDFFAKWWYQDESSTPSDETAEQSLKRRCTQLRTRETFMQVILILEILSLEELPEMKEMGDKGKDTKSKSKKAEQLTLSLELLVDKLCIWHSLHTADLLGEAPKPDKTAKDKDGASQLQSFCVDVIIPFYMSRTLEHASSVSKKLGGPTTSAANPRPKSNSIRKPSEVEAKTDVEKKARRSFQRVGTEIHPQSAKTPRSFSRSATDSQVVPIKRETPEISLSSIPIRRDSQPTSVSARKNDVLERHRLRQREVDFGAIAAANEAKAKKRLEVEQKLKDAISTLKKPSRAAVSGEFADALEQRKRMAEGRARPSLSKRNSSAAQISATPKNGHKTTAIAATPHHIPAPSFVRPAIPSSGPSLVPSSNIKPKSLSFAHFPPADDDSDEDAIPATDHRPRHRNALAETPLKPRVGFATFPGASPDEDHDSGEDRDVSPLRESPTLLKTPSKPQRPRFSITPIKPAAPLSLGKGVAQPIAAAISAGSVAATPIKGKSSLQAEPGRTDAADQKEDHDIYDMLGWNDEVDDD